MLKLSSNIVNQNVKIADAPKPMLCKTGSRGVVTLSGMSGTGKTTIERLLTHELAHMGRVISHTTRKPRPNEATTGDNRAYYFSTDEEFDVLTKIEHTEFNGFRYCVAEQEAFRLFDLGYNVLICVCDYNGVHHFYDWCERQNIWYLPFLLQAPLHACATRLIERSGHSDSDMIPTLSRIGHLAEEYVLFNRLKSQIQMLEFENTIGPRNGAQQVLNVVRDVLNGAKLCE